MLLLAEAFDPLRSVQATGVLFRRAPLTLFVGGLVPIGMQLAIQLPLQFLIPLPFFFAPRPNQELLQRVLPFVFVFACVVALASIALSCWIDVGFCRAIELALRTGKDQVHTIFRGADRFWTLLLARVLMCLAFLALMLPAILMMMVLGVFTSLEIPDVFKFLAALAALCISLAASIYLLLGFSMVTAIVALENCSASAAIGRSWRYARGNRLRLIWFHLFIFFLSLVGTLACGIGMLITIPLIEAMRYEAYITLTKGTQFPQWWIGSGRQPSDFGSPPAAPA
jgi:hypothetical protein